MKMFRIHYIKIDNSKIKMYEQHKAENIHECFKNFKKEGWEIIKITELI
jgi:hypothetical protein